MEKALKEEKTREKEKQRNRSRRKLPKNGNLPTIEMHSSSDPMHGVTLEMILNSLVKQYGWEKLGSLVNINCFNKACDKNLIID